jgi:hypothetical protein
LLVYAPWGLEDLIVFSNDLNWLPPIINALGLEAREPNGLSQNQRLIFSVFVESERKLPAPLIAILLLQGQSAVHQICKLDPLTMLL